MKQTMLHSYLCKHFLEEQEFTNHADISQGEFVVLLQSNTVPSPSYILNSDSVVDSFIGKHNDTATYRFHLKGHLRWLAMFKRHSLTTEKRARLYFDEIYTLARKLYFSSEHGEAVLALCPNLQKEFDSTKSDATWQYFLDGVYGVCTRDGWPDTIFLKQVGVMSIERLTKNNSARNLCSTHLQVLSDSVEMLDQVESDFAPKEVKHVSRQRCINEVRTRYFNENEAS